MCDAKSDDTRWGVESLFPGEDLLLPINFDEGFANDMNRRM